MKLLLSVAIGLSLVACGGTTPEPSGPAPAVELKHFPIDSLSEVRATASVALDANVSSDGKGSLRVDAPGPLLVPLFEVSDVAVEEAALVYEAKLQTENLNGQAYVEMWLRFPGQGEFFSRGLERPLTGTMSWTTVSTPFFLQKGQRPDLIRLNLVVSGPGRVWVDDVRLQRQPLPGR